MGLSYWTTFTLKGRRFDGAEDPFEKLKALKFAEAELAQTSELNVILALVGDITEQDLLALENAVVTKHKNCWLAYRPNDFDGVGNIPDFRRLMFDNVKAYAEYHRQRFIKTSDKFLVIKDGKFFDTACENCTHLKVHLVDQCAVPLVCSNRLFDNKARIRLPDKDKYVPVNCCTEYTEFQARSPDELADPEDINLQRLEPRGRGPAISLAGWTTRYYRQMVCQHCIFSYVYDAGKNHGCSVSDYAERHCGGPVFEADIPQVSTEMRCRMNIAGASVPQEKMKQLALGPCSLLPTHSRLPHRWPSACFEIHGYNASANTYQIGWKSHSRTFAPLTFSIKEDLLFPVLFPGKKLEDFKPTCHQTLFERIVALYFKDAQFDSEPRRYGWGNRSRHQLSRLTLGYRESGVSGIRLHYTSCYWDYETKYNDINQLVSQYGLDTVLCQTQTPARKELRDLIARRKLGAVEKFVQAIKQTAEKGLRLEGQEEEQLLKKILVSS